jgi:protein phosphatase
VTVDHPVTNLIESEGLVIASATDVGRKRSGNEDAHALWVSEDAAVRARRGLLFVVCDGMGGANAGEVASQLAVETVLDVVRTAETPDPAATLREAVESANGAVHSQATANTDQRGMGTTCTALLVRGKEVWIGHVGDSRAYLVRGGKIQKLTQDHSLVAELIEKGHLTEAEAKHDHRRNVVTRSVGALEHVQVDAERVVDKLRPGDALVICSDGLHGQVTDFEIGMIAGEQAPDEACASLIDLANERGGPDNITAIVVRVGGVAAASGDGKAKAKEAGAKMPPNLGLLGGAAALLLLLVVGVGSVLMGQLKSKGGETAGAGAPVPGGERPVSARPSPGVPEPTSTRPPADTSAPAPADLSPRGEPAAEPASPPARPAPQKPVPARPKPSEPAAAQGPGTVRFMTRPFQPSTFSIDGQPYAQDVGFFSQSLPAGDHVVRVEGLAGGSVDVPVHVEPGGSYSLVAELPSDGVLGSIEIVLSGATRAQVLVDGAQYPEPAPCVVRNLTPGPHTLRVIRPRSAPAQGPAEVQVAAGSSVRAEYHFGAGH